MAQQSKLISIRQAVGHGKKYFEKIAGEQKNGMVWAKESGFVMQIIEASEYLQKCPVESFRKAIINVASIGLSLNPAEKLAYLVPRDGKACLDISYRGLVKIATDSGSIIWAKAMLVHDSDTFEFTGVDTKPIHKFNAFDKEDIRGKIIGGYSIAKLHNGDYLVDAMSMPEIEEVKKTSKAQKGPWKTWPEEMMKKTLLRRGSKSWPISNRFMEAESLLNEHQGLSSTSINEDVNDAVILVNDDEINELNELAKKSHVNVNKIYEAFGISSINELAQSEFAACKSRLNIALKAHIAKTKKTGKKDANPSTEG